MPHNKRKNIPHNIMRSHPLPHHGCNEKGESPEGPKVNHKCNVTSQGLRDGGGPIKYAT